MKKILIVNNNLDMGGIQKSLINLLKSVSTEYEITLLLFYKNGSLLKDVPKNVRIITPLKVYKILGMNKDDLKKHPILFLNKAIFKFISKLFSRRFAMKLMGIFQKKYLGYDCIISYSHLTYYKDFSNGCGEFVLDKTICDNKVCLIHCDYQKSGFDCKYNNDEYTEFNRVACCSDSVKKIFEKFSGINKEKIYVLRNFYDLKILELAKHKPYQYDNKYINLLTVARLSEEKGIDKFLHILNKCQRKDIRYYIIGEGPQKQYLEKLIHKYEMENRVFLLGEKINPYRYMVGVDYLLLPSIHEAAPIVFDEANLLKIPVISTETLSAKEIILNGIVDNNLEMVINNLNKKFENKKSYSINNDSCKEQLNNLLGGEMFE